MTLSTEACNAHIGEKPISKITIGVYLIEQSGP